MVSLVAALVGVVLTNGFVQSNMPGGQNGTELGRHFVRRMSIGCVAVCSTDWTDRSRYCLCLCHCCRCFHCDTLGRYSDAERTACIKCPPGKASGLVPGSSCITCEDGTSSYAGSAFCISCADIKVQPAEVLWLPDKLGFQCAGCPDGKNQLARSLRLACSLSDQA